MSKTKCHYCAIIAEKQQTLEMDVSKIMAYYMNDAVLEKYAEYAEDTDI